MSPTEPLSLGMFNVLIVDAEQLRPTISNAFHNCGLHGELYPETPSELATLMALRPGGELAPFTAHLPRNLDLRAAACHEEVLAFSRQAGPLCRGFTIHDQSAMFYRPETYASHLHALGQRLALAGGPTAFIEFSGALSAESFTAFFEQLGSTPCIGACIDIGHVAGRVATESFAAKHSGTPVCRLSEGSPDILDLLDDVAAATLTVRPAVINMIRRMQRTAHPVHFHLHDGNPLLKNGPYGLCDHHSFSKEFALLFEDGLARQIPPFFGPDGLTEIVTEAMRGVEADSRSFLLEIHPSPQRLVPPPELADIWQSKAPIVTERCYAWAQAICRNGSILKRAIQQATSLRQTAEAAAT